MSPHYTGPAKVPTRTMCWLLTLCRRPLSVPLHSCGMWCYFIPRDNQRLARPGRDVERLAGEDSAVEVLLKLKSPPPEVCTHHQLKLSSLAGALCRDASVLHSRLLEGRTGNTEASQHPAL